MNNGMDEERGGRYHWNSYYYYLFYFDFEMLKLLF
jgi:hypothetical protein